MTENALFPFVLLFDIAFAWLVFFQWFGRYIWNYRVTEKSIQIVLFGTIPIINIDYDAMAYLCELTTKEVFTKGAFVYRWGNKLFTRHNEKKKKNKGLIKTIIITPDDAQAFVQEVRRHMHTLGLDSEPPPLPSHNVLVYFVAGMIGAVILGVIIQFFYIQ